jgi:hypothetical protein
MSLGTALAVWGAVLSTALAIAHFWSRWSDRPEIEVKTGWQRRALSREEASDARGTPSEVERDGVLLMEELLVGVTILNRGRRAVQITAVIVESVERDDLNVTLLGGAHPR